MKIEVDLNTCLGYAICVGIAPDYYELDENGIARVLKIDVATEDENRVRETAAVCPQLAIHTKEG